MKKNTSSPTAQTLPVDPNPQHHDDRLDSSRKLLIACAEHVQRGDLPAARRAASSLSETTSPDGDSADRIVYQFARSLSFRLGDGSLSAPSSLPSSCSESSNLCSSYLSFNQIAPFLRFAHLTANQAILEALDGCRRVHILDLDTLHGVQWPPLLQAIADSSDLSDPPFIRITGTGGDLEVLRRTGDRLQTFAESLGLRFQFHPLLLTNCTSFFSSCLQMNPAETFVVNSVLFLHKLLSSTDRGGGGGDEVRSFLEAVRAMNPTVVTVAEREATHNSAVFLQRFVAALEYYTAVFESLEATLPPTSRERMEVEQVWLGREIEGVVRDDDDYWRRERHEKLEWWEGVMRAAGFVSRPASDFAVSQAKLLLRLHYPAEGYTLQTVRDAFFLGWQNKPLYSVTSWHLKFD